MAIARTYGYRVVQLSGRTIPKNTLTDSKGGRVRADSLIRFLKYNIPDSIDYVVGVLSKDMCFDKKDSKGKIKEPVWKYSCWGIFGLGYLNGPSCVVSTTRPKKYCKSETQFIESMQKISIHELGHNLGLPHCKHDSKCVMQDAAESISTIHLVGFNLCKYCRSIIENDKKSLQM